MPNPVNTCRITFMDDTTLENPWKITEGDNSGQAQSYELIAGMVLYEGNTYMTSNYTIYTWATIKKVEYFV